MVTVAAGKYSSNDQSRFEPNLRRNAAQPVVTLLAIDLPELFTGAVVIETIFAWPGMGRLYLESVVRLDYPVLRAILTVAALLIILSSLAADMAYAYLDPRVRYR